MLTCWFCAQGCKQWFEVQDLHVADVLPEMITLSQSYIQVRSPQPQTVGKGSSIHRGLVVDLGAGAQSRREC